MKGARERVLTAHEADCKARGRHSWIAYQHCSWCGAQMSEEERKAELEREQQRSQVADVKKVRLCVKGTPWGMTYYCECPACVSEREQLGVREWEMAHYDANGEIVADYRSKKS